MEEKIISLPPSITQICLKRLGAYCSTQLAEDKYYMFSVVKILLEYIEQEKGEDWLKLNYPYYEENLERKLMRLESIVNVIKGTLDTIQDKTLERKNSEVQKKQEYIKALMKLPLFEDDLMKLFIFLQRKTTIGRAIMKAEDFRELDLAKHRKTELNKERSSASL